MSIAEKAKYVLEELNIIEGMIRPYEAYSYEVSRALEVIDTFRENLKTPEAIDWKQVLEFLEKAEGQLNYYRGQGPADEILIHVRRMKSIIGKP